MKPWLLALLLLLPAGAMAAPDTSPSQKSVVVIPIRENIAPPLVYLVRRAVKQAIEDKADVIVLDMKTNGGRLDTTEEIIAILGEFKGDSVTFVNDRAFSAGAFIAVATKRIYMAPQSVIGAAAPVMVGPTGGAEGIPEAVEVKTKSAVRGLIRGVALKNGHNPDVLEAMIDRNKELIIDGEVINSKGDILTLTDVEAAREYGNPPRPLLSAGTVASLDALLAKLGYEKYRRVAIKPSGAERLGTWINAISPLLLIIGAVGLYIEFKTPGFGAPGVIGIAAFALYFVGGYIAGFSGFEWLLVFLVGLTLLALEFFVFPGTIFLGVAGAALMVFSIVMALIDLYPGVPSGPGGISWPTIAGPTSESVERALRTLLLALAGVAIGVWLASRWLPKTSLYGTIVSQGVSGAETSAAYVAQENSMVGRTGVTISPLRPGGKAQFGDSILDVTSQGEMIPSGASVRIIAFSAGTPIVEAA